jgi:ribonuclease BN (tRNA processing enzyme)
MRNEFDFRKLVEREAVRIGPFTVTPHLVSHPAEAYGIRVEADGEVLAYTGDTDTCDGLKTLFHDATLVLTDSAFIDGRDHAPGIHLSGSRAAQAAVDAGGVRRLMLTHIPPWNDPAVCRAQAAAVWPGDVELAQADAVYEL